MLFNNSSIGTIRMNQEAAFPNCGVTTDLANPDEDSAVPYIIESDRSPAACRKSCARLIQKIYMVDPLICPKCRGTIRVISSIEDQDVIKTILKHLGLWLIRSRPPTKANAPPIREYATDDACQTAIPDNAAYGDPDYPWETYV